MTILSRCFTYQVAIPLLGIEVCSFLPCFQCFQSIHWNLSTELWSFKNANAQTPPRLNESESLGVEPDHEDALNAPQ